MTLYMLWDAYGNAHGRRHAVVREGHTCGESAALEFVADHDECPEDGHTFTVFAVPCAERPPGPDELPYDGYYDILPEDFTDLGPVEIYEVTTHVQPTYTAKRVNKPETEA